MKNKIKGLSESKRAEIKELHGSMVLGVSDSSYDKGFADGQASTDTAVGTIKLTSVDELKVGDKVRFIGPQSAHLSNQLTVGRVYEINGVSFDPCDKYAYFLGDNDDIDAQPIISRYQLYLFEKVVESEGYNPQILMYDESIEPVDEPATLTVNQQRAELIRNSEESLQEQHKPHWDKKEDTVVSDGEYVYTPKFIIDTEERKVVCLLSYYSQKKVKLRGIAYCPPNEVFNADIYKLIALYKALQIDIPQEFIDVVQPDVPVVGMIFKGCEGDIREIAPPGHYSQESMKSSIDSEYVEDYPIQIIDDTKAEYEEVESTCQ